MEIKIFIKDEEVWIHVKYKLASLLLRLDNELYEPSTRSLRNTATDWNFSATLRPESDGDPCRISHGKDPEHQDRDINCLLSPTRGYCLEMEERREDEAEGHTAKRSDYSITTRS